MGSFMASGTNIVSYELGKVGLPVVNSKGFFMFLAVDASSTIDFSRAAIDEGVVDSLPREDIGQTLVCSPSLLKSSRKDGIYRSLCSEKYRESTNPHQLYGNGPSHVSNGLDMTNVGESSPHYGVDDSEVCSEARPTVEKTIMYTRGPHGLPFQHYARKQLQRRQCWCDFEGTGSEGIRRWQAVERREASSKPDHACEKIEQRKEWSMEVVANKCGNLLHIKLTF